MKQGQKFIVIRFGANIIEDAIQKHIEVLNDKGYCWFGKIGVVPSEKSINYILNDENPMIILYSRNGVYKCAVSEKTRELPNDGYPNYYEGELFNTARAPKICFKLSSIESIDSKILQECIVVSSRNNLQTTLNKSMSSFFFAEFPEKGVFQSNTAVQKTKEEKTKIVDNNSCKYKKNGKCSKKSCVNYLYECERPSMCTKQKL